MSPEYFYINLQSQYSVKVINFNHFLSSPLLVQGIWLTLQQLNWFFPSFLVPHSLQPLSRKGPEAPAIPHPQTDPCHSVCKPRHAMWVPQGPDLCLVPGKTQKRTRHGENRFPFSLQPPHRESWEMDEEQEGTWCVMGWPHLGPPKVSHSWIQNHQEGEQAWPRSVNTLCGQQVSQAQGNVPGAPEAWWGLGKTGEYCSERALVSSNKNPFHRSKIFMCG